MAIRTWDIAAWHNMQEVFRHCQALDGDRELIRYIQGEDIIRVSACDFWKDVRGCAGWIHRQGWGQENLGVMGKNSYLWLVHFFGIIAAGAVAVPLDPQLSGEDLKTRLKQADIRILFSDRPDMEDLDQGILCHLFGQKWESKDLYWPENSRSPRDPACMIFTSGTTARPKLVVMSQRGMAAGACNDIVGDSFDVQLALLPFHHLAGFNPVLNTLLLGGIICLEENLQYIMRDLELLQPDYMFAVPSLVRIFAKRLSRTPEGDLYGRSLGWNLRLLGSGGASFEPDVMRIFDGHGIRVMQGYGASETGGVGLTMTMRAGDGNSIGRGSDQIQVRLDEGELMLRCDSLMLGYYKDPEATRQVLEDGWYHTGDICRQDDQGYLYILGRKKNLIILSNGENISPEAIEVKLMACPEITEVMVYEVKDQLACCIRLQNEGISKEEGRRKAEEFVHTYSEEAPGYARIRYIEWRDDPFPRNAMGKLIRSCVKEEGEGKR